MEKTKMLTVSIPVTLHRELKLMASASDTTMTEIIIKEILGVLSGENNYPIKTRLDQAAALRSMGNADKILGEIIDHAIRIHKMFAPPVGIPVPGVPPAPPVMPPGYVPQVTPPAAAPAPGRAYTPAELAANQAKFKKNIPATPGTDPVLAAAREKDFQDYTREDAAALLAAGEIARETADAVMLNAPA